MNSPELSGEEVEDRMLVDTDLDVLIVDDEELRDALPHSGSSRIPTPLGQGRLAGALI